MDYKEIKGVNNTTYSVLFENSKLNTVFISKDNKSFTKILWIEDSKYIMETKFLASELSSIKALFEYNSNGINIYDSSHLFYYNTNMNDFRWRIKINNIEYIVISKHELKFLDNEYRKNHKFILEFTRNGINSDRKVLIYDEELFYQRLYPIKLNANFDKFEDENYDKEIKIINFRKRLNELDRITGTSNDISEEFDSIIKLFKKSAKNDLGKNNPDTCTISSDCLKRTAITGGYPKFTFNDSNSFYRFCDNISKEEFNGLFCGDIVEYCGIYFYYDENKNLCLLKI